MAFSESSACISFVIGPFIISFIMICESKLSVSQDGLLLTGRSAQFFKFNVVVFFFGGGGEGESYSDSDAPV
jgi:hypothetical protein